MIFFIPIFIIFLCLMLLPIAMGRLATDGTVTSPLHINNDNARDPRYFAKRFTAMMEDALLEYDGKSDIYLSKTEKLRWASDLADTQEYDEIICAQDTFQPESAHIFHKEIYVKGDAHIPRETHMRAIACLQKLDLGEACVVDRWVDAQDKLFVAKNCDLGISATSGGTLHLSTDCAFRRLFAPRIVVSNNNDEAHGAGVSSMLHPRYEIYEEVRTDIENVNSSEIVDASIITRKDLTLGEGAQVRGSIKADGHIHICAGAMVTGSVFAGGNIVIEKGVKILNVVFSQSNIFLGPNCTIGSMGKIKSLIAKDSLTLCENSTVYGYACCEKQGATVSESAFFDIIQDFY